MKRLLLLFILSPVILFGQTRRKAVVDSIKAATTTDLQNVSTLLGNNPGTKVEHVEVLDSGEYVTIVARIHVGKADIITAIPAIPIVKIKTRNIAADGVSALTVPPLPAPVQEAEVIMTLPHLSVVKIKTDDIVDASVSAVTVPPLPAPVAAGDTTVMLPMAVLMLNTDIALSIMDQGTVPPLPDLISGTIEDVPSLAAVTIVIKRTPPGRMDTIAVPSFEEKKMQVAGMHLSAQGYGLLEKLEGFSPELYNLKDGGFTIGFGFFIPYGEGSKWNDGVTWEEAERMIREKVPVYEDQVKRYINVPLTQKEFDALTMLAYNLGGFSRATSIVNDVNDLADFDKLQSDWGRFIHSKAPGVTRGLINRRRDEMGVRRDADYQPERKIQILTKK